MRSWYFRLERSEQWDDRGVERFYVYILEMNRTPGRYVGQTGHPRQRMREHAEGETKTTKGAAAELVYMAELPTRGEAVRYERLLKRMHERWPEDVGLLIRASRSETERVCRRAGVPRGRRAWNGGGADGSGAAPRRWREGAFAPVAGRGAVAAGARVVVVCGATVCAALLLWKLADRFVGSQRGRDVAAAEAGVGSDAGGQVATGGREEEAPSDGVGAGTARPERSLAAVPSIDEIRADATMAMNEVEVLHGEMIRILEARMAAAQDDNAATKSATDALTLAQFAKRQDMDLLRGDVAADTQWRIESALSKAAIIRDQLQAEIAALQEEPGNGSPGGNAEGMVAGVTSSAVQPTKAAPVRVGADVAAPTRTVYVEPVYPEIAKRARLSGVVILEAVIDASGNVTNVTVLRSVSLLDQAAVEAVRQWKYEPTVRNGVPVAIAMTVRVVFDLG